MKHHNYRWFSCRQYRRIITVLHTVYNIRTTWSQIMTLIHRSTAYMFTVRLVNWAIDENFSQSQICTHKTNSKVPLKIQIPVLYYGFRQVRHILAFSGFMRKRSFPTRMRRKSILPSTHSRFLGNTFSSCYSNRDNRVCGSYSDFPCPYWTKAAYPNHFTVNPFTKSWTIEWAFREQMGITNSSYSP